SLLSTLFPYTTLFRSLDSACDFQVSSLRMNPPVQSSAPPESPHSSPPVFQSRPSPQVCPRASARLRAMNPIRSTASTVSVPQSRSEEHTSELQSRFDL